MFTCVDIALSLKTRKMNLVTSALGASLTRKEPYRVKPHTAQKRVPVRETQAKTRILWEDYSAKLMRNFLLRSSLRRVDQLKRAPIRFVVTVEADLQNF